jgi:hypothetical protein
VPFGDRVFVLVANRLQRPHSEHGLARWLETDFVCDRQGRRFVPQWKAWNRFRVAFRQLHAWYRTLDGLERAKNSIEVALYHRFLVSEDNVAQILGQGQGYLVAMRRRQNP